MALGGRWQVAIKVITGFQTKPKVSKCFGEAMAGVGGGAFPVIRPRAKPSGRS